MYNPPARASTHSPSSTTCALLASLAVPTRTHDAFSSPPPPDDVDNLPPKQCPPVPPVLNLAPEGDGGVDDFRKPYRAIGFIPQFQPAAAVVVLGEGVGRLQPSAAVRPRRCLLCPAALCLRSPEHLGCRVGVLRRRAAPSLARPPDVIPVLVVVVVIVIVIVIVVVVVVIVVVVIIPPPSVYLDSFVTEHEPEQENEKNQQSMQYRICDCSLSAMTPLLEMGRPIPGLLNCAFGYLHIFSSLCHHNIKLAFDSLSSLTAGLLGFQRTFPRREDALATRGGR